MGCHKQIMAGDLELQELKEKAGSCNKVYSGISATIHASICQDSILFSLLI